LLTYWGSAAETYDLPPDIVQVWRDAAADPAKLLDDPDFCFREGFLLTVGRFPAASK
jgi:arsenite methyltransferase